MLVTYLRVLGPDYAEQIEQSPYDFAGKCSLINHVIERYRVTNDLTGSVLAAMARKSVADVPFPRVESVQTTVTNNTWTTQNMTGAMWLCKVE